MNHRTTVALAQYPISFHAHADDWAAHIGRWIGEAAAQGAQLLLFPEYGAMELASLMPEAARNDLQVQIRRIDQLKGHFMAVFGQWAKHYGLVVVAPSLPIITNGRCVNRCYVFGPNGTGAYQDKFFMTRFETEDWMIEPGAAQLALFESDWCTFGIQTCYDVEFPVGSALLCRYGADLILAPSCTETARGAARVHVGARARALENQCYVGVSQVVGNALWSPAVDINYGYTALYSTPDTGFPDDGILAQTAPQQPGWLVQTLDFDAINNVRVQGTVLNARDQRQIEYRFDNQIPVIQKVRLA